MFFLVFLAMLPERGPWEGVRREGKPSPIEALITSTKVRCLSFMLNLDVLYLTLDVVGDFYVWFRCFFPKHASSMIGF